MRKQGGRKLKIAFTGARGIPALYSGFETAVTEIGRRLAERGHDVVVYCRNGYGDQTQTHCMGMRKVYLPRINIKVADTLSHTFFSFVHLLFNAPDALIVVNPANGPLCLIPRFRRTPFAINVDGLEWKRAKWPWIGQRYFYFASWFCTKIAPEIIADSVGIQKFYKDRWNRDSFFAAYGAYPEKSTKPELLEEFELARGKYFVVVARLEPENNTDLIIREFAKVKTDNQLIIVGGTNFKSAYLDNLKAETTDPRVRFVGGIYDQEKLTEVMCNSLAYIHGHMVGGTNPVLLKALGGGCCVIYMHTDWEFNDEVVGDAGIPFTQASGSLSAVMQEMADDPDKAEPYRELGPKRIESNYTWDMVTDRYEELCYRLADRGKKRR